MAQTETRTEAPPARPPAPPSVKPAARRAPWPVEVYRSAVGKKYVMAVTGIVLLGYVLAHMVGNLHLYGGPEEVNVYAEELRELGGELVPRTSVLWLLRTGLIAAFFLHVHAAWSLTRMNQRANGGGYRSPRDYAVANYASRTMRWTGVIVGLFVVFHLLDLTWGQANPEFVRGDVYHNVVESFERVPVAIAYIVANLALGLHIFHGAWSMFQSLGLNNPRFNHWRRLFAGGLAVAVTGGNVLFPIMVLAGVFE